MLYVMRILTKKDIFICNSQKVEANKMSFNRQMAKQTVLYPYHGIILTNKKEKTIDMYNIDAPQG